MVFNSITFLAFFGVTFVFYWLLQPKGTQLQNYLLLIASYFFYGFWDWRFLLLLVGQSVASFFIANKIARAKNDKQGYYWLVAGVALVLLVLIFFKYFNFFSVGFSRLLNLVGLKSSPVTLQLVLPLGISFFSFKILAYLFDVYRKSIEPEGNVVNYLLFVSFFPQLLAGPIERAQTLLPQIRMGRIFSYRQAVWGQRLILWGMFKKVVVADNCANYVADIFGNPGIYNASTLLLGAVYFAFQVYADFSGYSDMAVGFGKLLGFDLMKNFDYPFSSKNITEFWRRWHISLGSWFNDYVFTPLFAHFREAGNKAMYACIIITFLLSGLWHGASWHFVFFGFLHGSAIVVETALKKKRKIWSKKLGGNLYNKLSVGLTFIYLLITWIYFRADNMQTASKYIMGLFSESLFEIPQKLAYIPFFALMLIIEYGQRKSEQPIAFSYLPQWLRWTIYLALFFITIYYFGQEQPFYYFKF